MEVTRSHQMLFLKYLQFVLEWSQFGTDSMLGVIDLQPILEHQFCFLSDGAQLRMLVEVGRGENGIGEALQAVLQISDPLHDLGRGHLRPDVGIEGDFALPLLNVLRDGYFLVVNWMDDLWNDAYQWIGVRHIPHYMSETLRVEYPAGGVAVRADSSRLPIATEARKPASLKATPPQPDRP